MAKHKDPAAVALGRKGGAVSGIKKGFLAMPVERVAEIQALALAARKAKRKGVVVKRTATSSEELDPQISLREQMFCRILLKLLREHDPAVTHLTAEYDDDGRLEMILVKR